MAFSSVKAGARDLPNSENSCRYFTLRGAEALIRRPFFLEQMIVTDHLLGIFRSILNFIKLWEAGRVEQSYATRWTVYLGFLSYRVCVIVEFDAVADCRVLAS